MLSIWNGVETPCFAAPPCSAFRTGDRLTELSPCFAGAACRAFRTGDRLGVGKLRSLFGYLPMSAKPAADAFEIGDIIYTLVCFVCADHLAAFDFLGLDVYIKPVHGLFQGYLHSFDRMVFQQTGKQDNAGRFERGCLKATTENPTI